MMIKCIYTDGTVGYLNRDHILFVDDRDNEYYVKMKDDHYVMLNKRANGEMTCFLENRTYKTNF